jgi:cold shock protein
MANRETGTVKWFDNAKGYGFIQRPDAEDVFVHYRAIRGEGFKTLQEGQQVNFNIVQGQKGLQAEDVSAE